MRFLAQPPYLGTHWSDELEVGADIHCGSSFLALVRNSRKTASAGDHLTGEGHGQLRTFVRLGLHARHFEVLAKKGNDTRHADPVVFPTRPVEQHIAVAAAVVGEETGGLVHNSKVVHPCPLLLFGVLQLLDAFSAALGHGVGF